MKDRTAFYEELRRKIGTRQQVAKLLGLCNKTIERRELGRTKITDEMVAALNFLIISEESSRKELKSAIDRFNGVTKTVVIKTKLKI